MKIPKVASASAVRQKMISFGPSRSDALEEIQMHTAEKQLEGPTVMQRRMFRIQSPFVFMNSPSQIRA